MPNLRHSLSTINPHKALTDSKAKTGRTIDLLYLDACLMGMWEVAHEVHNEVNYLLASESWSWTSFAYGAHLAAIANSRPTADVGAAWISNEAAVMAPIDHAYTYSLLDLSQMPTLTNRIDVLAQQLEPLAQSAEGKAQIRAAFAASDCFDSNGDTLINRKAPDVGKGIDTYCDLASFVAQDTHWDEFITQYWNAPAPEAPQCSSEPCELPGGPLEIGYDLYLPLVQR